MAMTKLELVRVSRLLSTALAISTTMTFGTAVAQTTARPATHTTTVVHAAHMLDGVTKELKGETSVTIVDGKITAVAPGKATVAGAELVELGDQTLLPGLIDCHKHIGPPATGMNPMTALMVMSPLESAIGSSVTARKLLEEGFTTIRTMGAGGGMDLSLKRAIDQGWVPGPRMIVSLEPLGPSGGHSDPRNGLDPAWENENWGASVVDGPIEARKQVREHKRRGADVIKIMPSGGVLSIGDDPRQQLMTDDEIKSVIDTAHSLGMKVAAHAHGKQAIDHTVELGVDSIEHGTYADDESFKLFVKHGTYLVPTMLVADQVVVTAREHPELLNPSSAQKALETAPHINAMTGSAYKAGVKIAFGTDTSRGKNAHEFALMVGAGISPADAIMAATHNAADLLGVSETQGSIQTGRYADLIAVKGSPLDNISTMEDVQWVMKNGVVYKEGGKGVYR